MNDWRKVLLVSTIALLVLMFASAFIRQSLKSKTVVASPAPQASVVIQDDYSGWTLFRNGYAFPVPPKWKNTSDTGGVAILEPGDKIGSLEQISMRVLSDKKAPAGQQFTGQQELEQWATVSGQVQGDVQKTKNVSLDGAPGVMLVDTTGEVGKWVAMAWARRDSINFQLRFTGSGTYTDQDKKTVDYIISHFTFTPPPFDDKQEK